MGNVASSPFVPPTDEDSPAGIPEGDDDEPTVEVVVLASLPTLKNRFVASFYPEDNAPPPKKPRLATPKTERTLQQVLLCKSMLE